MHNPPLFVHLPFFSTSLMLLIMHDVAGPFRYFRYRLFFRNRFVSLSTFWSAEALRRCLTSSRRSLLRCKGLSWVGTVWMGLEGLKGLEGLMVGEDMQLRKRLNVQETVTNNTWREDVWVEQGRMCTWVRSVIKHKTYIYFLVDVGKCKELQILSQIEWMTNSGTDSVEYVL